MGPADQGSSLSLTKDSELRSRTFYKGTTFGNQQADQFTSKDKAKLAALRLSPGPLSSETSSITHFLFFFSSENRTKDPAMSCEDEGRA